MTRWTLNRLHLDKMCAIILDDQRWLLQLRWLVYRDCQIFDGWCCLCYLLKKVRFMTSRLVNRERLGWEWLTIGGWRLGLDLDRPWNGTWSMETCKHLPRTCEILAWYGAETAGEYHFFIINTVSIHQLSITNSKQCDDNCTLRT